ncbi:response regulator transcription factor [Parachitinimonas caeni]|uniref:Response regulator n=1 Tax=Parachitinimonas caeni TaxID=3031301 RepID=A0ABT7E0B5_9NEIS|nr:response regulator [Parachitinimonas caeni]MDK2125743.1 response regulator [Parachitinimonas caeni]
MNPTIYLVDDDDAIRDSLSWMLQARGLDCRDWASGEAFLASYDAGFHGCLVLDIRMGGMSGLQVFDVLLERGCTLPVIFLTGHGDIPMAVGAVKRGAYDFIEKPFNSNTLADVIEAALKQANIQRKEAASDAEIEARLRHLTPREREVMDRVLAGKLNKVIADELNLAMRTVEVHRANVFDKMGVRSAVELSQLLGSKHR